jgi:DNA integrity scanning protein DisA with diadenylate cyclase activity
MWKKIDKFMLMSAKTFVTTLKIFTIPFIAFAYIAVYYLQKEVGETATVLSVAYFAIFLLFFVVEQLQEYSANTKYEMRAQHKEYKNKFLNSLSKKFVEHARTAEKRRKERRNKRWPF